MRLAGLKNAVKGTTEISAFYLRFTAHVFYAVNGVSTPYPVAPTLPKKVTL